MKKTKRLVLLMLTMFLMLAWLPMQVSANSPPPAPHYTFQLTGLPEGAMYADILIPLDISDAKYVEVDMGKLPEGFSADSEILSYSEDGYRSYTFHYLDALSVPVLNKGKAFFFVDAKYAEDYSGDIRHSHKSEIEELGCIRLAILDKSGNILHISPVFTLTSRRIFAFPGNEIYYNVETEEFRMEYLESSFAMALYVVLAVVGMVFTCISELVVSFLFRLPKGKSGLIVLTNCVSQILMHAVYLLLYSAVFWRYSQLVILLEVLIYGGEYLWYTYKLRDASRLRILLYTVTANTASLALGLALYLYL